MKLIEFFLTDCLVKKAAERKNKDANLSPECDFYGKGCFNCDKKNKCKKESEDDE